MMGREITGELRRNSATTHFLTGQPYFKVKYYIVLCHGLIHGTISVLQIISCMHEYSIRTCECEPWIALDDFISPSRSLQKGLFA